MPVILATQEAEIRRVTVQSQPRQRVHETLSRKPITKNWTGGVAQGEGPEFKPQYHKKKKKKLTMKTFMDAIFMLHITYTKELTFIEQ
jgi:hypothetical protein